jgi:rubrerythrin
MSEIEEALYTALRELTERFLSSEKERQEDSKAVSEALLALKQSVSAAVNLSEQVEQSAKQQKTLIDLLEVLRKSTEELTQQNVALGEEMSSLLEQNRLLAERVALFETFMRESRKRY